MDRAKESGERNRRYSVIYYSLLLKKSNWFRYAVDYHQKAEIENSGRTVWFSVIPDPDLNIYSGRAIKKSIGFRHNCDSMLGFFLESTKPSGFQIYLVCASTLTHFRWSNLKIPSLIDMLGIALKPIIWICWINKNLWHFSMIMSGNWHCDFFTFDLHIIFDTRYAVVHGCLEMASMGFHFLVLDDLCDYKDFTNNHEINVRSSVCVYNP